MSSDQRRSDREPVTLFVEYEGADDLVGDYTENLSSGGTFVATNREIPIGQQIKLVLSFPGLLEPIAIEGTVRWTRGNKPAKSRGAMDLIARSLDTMQGQMSRVQLAQDPPDLLIRISREAALFYEFWRADELIEKGREAAEKALDDARL